MSRRGCPSLQRVLPFFCPLLMTHARRDTCIYEISVLYVSMCDHFRLSQASFIYHFLLVFPWGVCVRFFFFFYFFASLRLMTHTARRVFAAISRGLPCHT